MPNYLSPGVYVEEVEAGSRPIEGVGTAVAALVGFAEKGPLNQPTLVSNWTQFTEAFGDFQPDSYLAHAVYGYMQNGGSNCFIVRIGSGVAADGSAPAKAGTSKARAKEELAGPAHATVGGFTVTAIGTAAGKTVALEISDAGGDSPPKDQFKLAVVVDGAEAEVFDNVSITKGDTYVATRVNTHSKVISIDEPKPGTALTQPDKGTVALVAPPQPAPVAKFSPDDYVGNVAQRTGFSGLETIEEVTMVAVPDLVAAYEAGAIDAEGFKAVQLAVIAHCELMGDRVAILDPPPDLNPQQIKDWRVNQAGYDSKFATLYWPYPKVFDPASGTSKFVPPCGHMAGIWARNDDTVACTKRPPTRSSVARSACRAGSPRPSTTC